MTEIVTQDIQTSMFTWIRKQRKISAILFRWGHVRVQLRVVRKRNIAQFHAHDIITISAAYAITLHYLFRHRQKSAIAMRDLLPLAALEKDI